MTKCHYWMQWMLHAWQSAQRAVRDGFAIPEDFFHDASQWNTSTVMSKRTCGLIARSPSIMFEKWIFTGFSFAFMDFIVRYFTFLLYIEACHFDLLQYVHVMWKNYYNKYFCVRILACHVVHSTTNVNQWCWQVLVYNIQQYKNRTTVYTFSDFKYFLTVYSLIKSAQYKIQIAVCCQQSILWGCCTKVEVMDAEVDIDSCSFNFVIHS